MLTPITVRYDFRPVRRSLATAAVADLFGLPEREPPHTVCENLALDLKPGQRVLFVGPSGGGKSSLLRAVAKQLGALDALALELPDVPIIDALPGDFDARLARLAACGLGEARLLLRTPAELSEGQRYRFRLASALATGAAWVACDEFTASLDRTLAKVVAFNVRKLAARAGVGLLAATTHEDVIADFAPDVLVRCREGAIDVTPGVLPARKLSFANELELSEGRVGHWARFARWHYRGESLAFVRRVVLLTHRGEPVGICVFAAPPASLRLRTRFFGLQNPRSAVALAALNAQLWSLSRVVLHPTYRGAGLGAGFVRAACASCPVDWVETLTALGRANPIFERAGFVRVGVVPRTGRAGQYGPKGGLSAEALRRSRFSEPVYYLFDNRTRNVTRTDREEQP